MTMGLIARKVGMTRVFNEDGSSVPVTVLDASSNRVAQIKTNENDGYFSIQLAFGRKKANRLTKSESGHYAAAGIEAAMVLKEFRVELDVLSAYPLGKEVSVNIFSPGQKVDVTGNSNGKGFSGPIKRHNFSSNRASHGNSISHNSPGSISMAQDPGRVFPGKRMAGHYGAVRRTQQNLEVIRVDEKRGLILIKGSVPGSRGANLIVKPAIKVAG